MVSLSRPASTPKTPMVRNVIDEAAEIVARDQPNSASNWANSSP